MAMYVREGEFTSTIYTMIKEQKFKEAVQVLEAQLQFQSNSRAALSLLGYCYYQMQNWIAAADMYEQLVSQYSEVDDYKLHYAQALYKAGLFEEAMKQAAQIESGQYKMRVAKLQAAIKYGQDDLQATRALIDLGPANDPDTENNMGCVLFKERKYLEAAQKFHEALKMLGIPVRTATRPPLFRFFLWNSHSWQIFKRRSLFRQSYA